MAKNLKNFLFLSNVKAQALPYFLVMAMILVLSWAMTVNIAKVIRDRMILQNETDNTALSIATLQARTLNLLGVTNCLMAELLSVSSFPIAALFPMFSTDFVGGTIIPGIFSDYRCNCMGYVSHTGVDNIRRVVKRLNLTQETILRGYQLNYVNILNKFNKDGRRIVAVPSKLVNNISISGIFGSLSSVPELVSHPEQLLGIKKNTKGIKYYKTNNTCLYVYGIHLHVVFSESYLKDKTSWYVQDKDFNEQKIVALGIVESNSKINKGYPIFKKLLDISMPTQVAVSASATYNVKGAMFPDKEDTSTGLSSPVAVAVLILIAKQLYNLEMLSRFSSLIPGIGIVASTAIRIAEVTYAITATYNTTKETFNKTTPIWQYENAVDGGWDAHLVPVQSSSSSASAS